MRRETEGERGHCGRLVGCVQLHRRAVGRRLRGETTGQGGAMVRRSQGPRRCARRRPVGMGGRSTKRQLDWAVYMDMIDVYMDMDM